MSTLTEGKRVPNLKALASSIYSSHSISNGLELARVPEVKTRGDYTFVFLEYKPVDSRLSSPSAIKAAGKKVQQELERAYDNLNAIYTEYKGRVIMEVVLAHVEIKESSEPVTYSEDFKSACKQFEQLFAKNKAGDTSMIAAANKMKRAATTPDEKRIAKDALRALSAFSSALERVREVWDR